MARKNRNLAGFDDVANPNGKDKDEDNPVSEKQKETNDGKGSNDYLDQLIEGKPKKKTPSVTGIYLDEDVSDELNRLAKKGGRGAKSRIVNEALRKVFKEKGLL